MSNRELGVVWRDEERILVHLNPRDLTFLEYASLGKNSVTLL